MKNLESALTGKKLTDLEAVKVVANKELEPTKAEIASILTAFRDGDDILTIKKNIRRSKDGASLGFSMSQLREIDAGRSAKISELKQVQEAIITK
jgi:hypothetical protein